MTNKFIIAAKTDDTALVNRVYLKALRAPAPVLSFPSTRYVCLYVPYNSRCSEMVSSFRAKVLSDLKSWGIEAKLLTASEIERYKLYDRYSYEEYERAALDEQHLGASAPVKEDRYAECFNFLDDDEDFKDALDHFVKPLARKLNRPPTPEEVKAAWVNSPLMSLRFPNVKPDDVPFKRMSLYVGKTFKPKPDRGDAADQ